MKHEQEIQILGGVISLAKELNAKSHQQNGPMHTIVGGVIEQAEKALKAIYDGIVTEKPVE